MDITHILDGLNDAQRDAVSGSEKAALILAGAGSGKTRVLVHRIAWLIRAEGFSAHSVLAVTFTNKAAREMRGRIEDMLQMPTHGLWVGTFHGLAHRLLKAHWKEAGLPQQFQILDSDDQLRLVKRVCRELELDESRWPPKQAQWFINGQKDEGLRAAHIEASPGDLFQQTMLQVYRAYEIACERGGMVDFAELLLRAHELWLKNPDVLAHYQGRFRQILVDEFQDTNSIQYAWLRVLAGKQIPIVAVGDDDQSIYGWRGAEVGNILRFEKDFPGAKVVRLEQNYRSTAHILAAASGVIAGNADRLGKELWTEAEGGEKVRLIGHWDGDEEARWVGEEIEAMQSGTRGRAGMSLDDMAILVRASHQMRAFEDRFLTIGLPYRVIGGPRFYERLEIRDAMAYFRLAVSQDDDLAFERIYNTPKRGIGPANFKKIQDAARINGVSLLEGARIAVDDGAIKGKVGKGLAELVGNLDRWNVLLTGAGRTVARGTVRQPSANPSQAMDADVDGPIFEGDLRENYQSPLDELGGFNDGSHDPEFVDRVSVVEKECTHIELAEMILEESGYTTMWLNDKTPEAPGRLENLKELVKALESFENLQGFLEHVSLIMDNDTEDAEEKVTIMTLHAAKGLEYPAVFLPGWEDGLFPSQRSMDESGLKGLEEERRLAYVGITRAEEVCTISFAANRRVYGQWQSQLPSRFVDELPEAHVEVLTAPGLYGGGYGGMSGDFGGSRLEEKASRADAYNSPGWKRMQAQGSLRSKPAPNEAKGLVIDATAVSSFTQGDRVFHTKFGYGTVMGIEGDKLDIEFDKAGAKKVVSKFIVPAAQAGDVPF